MGNQGKVRLRLLSQRGFRKFYLEDVTAIFTHRLFNEYLNSEWRSVCIHFLRDIDIVT